MRKPLRAVTLLELLIAISLLAVLTTMLLSALGSYRKSTEAAQCVSRLRQIGIALQAYTGDFSGKLLPRYADDVGSKEPKGWSRRLLSLGYVSDPNLFFCPSFFPKNNEAATKSPSTVDASQGYGMRTWGIPGGNWNNSTAIHKPATAIEEPSRFFMVADSLWLNWNSQGYGITPGSVNQAVHLRHQGKANALFADGHIEAKTADYFKEISKSQAQYTSGKILDFVIVTPGSEPVTGN